MRRGWEHWASSLRIRRLSMGNLIAVFSSLKGKAWKRALWNHPSMRGSKHYKKRKLQVGIWKLFSSLCSRTGEQAVQRGCEISILGDNQNSTARDYEQPALLWFCFKQTIRPSDMQRSPSILPHSTAGHCQHGRLFFWEVLADGSWSMSLSD